MNLIDKDELLTVMSAHCTMCKKRSDYYPSKCKECDLGDGIDMIDCFETVEAIPIEWIEKWAENSDKKGHLFGHLRYYFEDMINEWREENENL